MNKIFMTLSAVAVCFLSLSCEKYLDRAPEANITDKDAFGNFSSFQGFIEQLYNCVMDPDKGGAWNKYLFADETLNNYPYNFDQGNYWGDESYFYGKPANPTTTETRQRRVWEWAWYALRVANMALEKIDGTEKAPSVFHGTQEEHDLLKGQAHFFRGWFYFEICRYWGGMPYITHVIDPVEDMTAPEYNRLTFQATALKMAEDFRMAADLLPDNWGNTTVGKLTENDNRDRINKFHALGYLGKALLYAASPMMNEEATGSNSFNPELCKRAADAFGELLKLADETKIYQLQPWETYIDMFCMPNFLIPGGVEVIMRPTMYDRWRSRWSTLGATVPSSLGMGGGSNADVPTNNIIQNYGMANGLPITDPESGYDPSDPWTGRDPRFYETIIKDGDRISDGRVAGAREEFAQLYNGGRHRSQINPPSVTGFYARKFSGLGKNFSSAWVNKLQTFVPYLRLSDVYLMYTEAVNFQTGGGPLSTSSNYGMTAADAVNAVRNRANVPDITAKYTSGKDTFFEEIVRERAVELILEGQRFCDLRRWNRNTDPRYLDKTAIDFDRGNDGKPVNLTERVIVHRIVAKKHNWLPIQVQFTKQFAGFPQNPGW